MNESPRHVEFGFTSSLAYAINGLLRTLCTQRNMKIHWVSGLAVMLVGMALPLELASRATLLFCVLLVIAMEVLNTALESFVDLHVQQYEQNAMIAKDAAAAAVLVFSVGAMVVFGDVLVHRWDMVSDNPEAVWRTVRWGVPILICVATILFSKRRIALHAVLLLTSIALLAFLAFHSRDEIFTLGSLTFIVSAFLARFRQPKLLSSEAIATG
jgi:diacylglycerol kinase